MLVHLADWCYRQRRLVVVLWIAALAAAFALAGSFGGETKQDYLQPGSESQAASETLQAQFPQKAGDTVQVVLHSEDGFSSAAVRKSAEDIFADVAADAHVMGVASPFSPGGASQISQDGKTAYADVALDKTADEYTAAEAKALIDPVLAAGDDTLRVEAGGPVAALVPDDPHRRGGHRPHRRGPDPAVHLRLRGGDGAAAPHRSVRPRHVDRTRRAAAPSRRRPGLGDRHRRDGRHRRRHRLRAADRHPVPQQPRRGTRPTTRDPDRDRDGRPRRGVRRPHRRGRDAGHPPGRSTGPGRLRLHRVAVRAGHHDRIVDAAAGHARLRRTQHRTPARAVREQEPARLRHDPLVPLEPVHPAPAMDRRDRWTRRPSGAGSPLARHAPGVPRRPERPCGLHHSPGLRPAR